MTHFVTHEGVIRRHDRQYSGALPVSERRGASVERPVNCRRLPGLTRLRIGDGYRAARQFEDDEAVIARKTVLGVTVAS